MGPVPVGINKFVFEADPPSPDLIPVSELVSVTVILLSCSYNGKEFVRVGYYVNNEYDTEELRENPPSKVAVDHIVRNVLAEKPRVTRFNIVWDNEGPEEEFPPEQPEADNAADDEEQYGAEDEDDEDEASFISSLERLPLRGTTGEELGLSDERLSFSLSFMMSLMRTLWFCRRR